MAAAAADTVVAAVAADSAVAVAEQRNLQVEAFPSPDDQGAVRTAADSVAAAVETTLVAIKLGSSSTREAFSLTLAQCNRAYCCFKHQAQQAAHTEVQQESSNEQSREVCQRVNAHNFGSRYLLKYPIEAKARRI
jgi:hypothetical protein